MRTETKDIHHAHLTIVFVGGHTKNLKFDMDNKSDADTLDKLLNGAHVVSVSLPYEQYPAQNYSEITDKVLRIRRDQVCYTEVTYVTYHERIVHPT